jgi:hypothetical protein
MSSAVPKQKGMREYQKTGLFTLKRALIDFGLKSDRWPLFGRGRATQVESGLSSRFGRR